jgi:anti-sigma B factor antagonist
VSCDRAEHGLLGANVTELRAERGDRGVVTVESTGIEIRIVLTGEIDMNTEPELDAAIDQVLSKPLAPIVVDVTDLRFLASCGVEFLARLYNAAHPGGHTVTVLNPTGPVLRILRIVGFGDRITVITDRG